MKHASFNNFILSMVKALIVSSKGTYLTNNQTTRLEKC